MRINDPIGSSLVLAKKSSDKDVAMMIKTANTAKKLSGVVFFVIE